MAKYAKLVIGQTYAVMGRYFNRGVELPVHDDLFDYLSGNPQFEVSEREEESQTPQDANTQLPQASGGSTEEHQEASEDAKTERETLLAAAEVLNLEFPKNISTKKLRELVEKAELE